MKNSTNKFLFIMIAVILVAFVGLYGYQNFGARKKASVISPLNSSYLIEGDVVQLVNGMASQALAPGSDIQLETKLIDQPVYGDLDNDGDLDAVVTLSYNPGGSGVFYYVAPAFKDGEVYRGGVAYFLGDRVSLQSVMIEGEKVLVNQLTRSIGEAFAEEPDKEETLILTLRGDQFIALPADEPTAVESQTDELTIDQVVSYKDLVVVSWPLYGAKISSPLKVQGKARGSWYFEASFPVTLVDADGNVLVEHYATAEGEWMTEDYVPFTSELSFVASPGAKGTLILKKDNPSGLPENDDEVRLPVTF